MDVLNVYHHRGALQNAKELRRPSEWKWRQNGIDDIWRGGEQTCPESGSAEAPEAGSAWPKRFACSGINVRPDHLDPIQIFPSQYPVTVASENPSIRIVGKCCQYRNAVPLLCKVDGQLVDPHPRTDALGPEVLRNQ